MFQIPTSDTPIHNLPECPLDHFIYKGRCVQDMLLSRLDPEWLNHLITLSIIVLIWIVYAKKFAYWKQGTTPRGRIIGLIISIFLTVIVYFISVFISEQSRPAPIM